MIYHWNDYAFRAGGTVLVDANIWVKAFPVMANPDAENPYAKFLERLVAEGVTIALDVIVTGEFVHTFVRIEHERHNQLLQKQGAKGVQFKEYRRSESYGKAISEARFQLEQILSFPNVKRVDHPFSQVDEKRVFDLLCKGEIDWNDLMLLEEGRVRHWVIASNDTDFVSADVDVVTDNPKLLELAEQQVP